MKISLTKTKYHRFSFTYSYDPEIVEFCRVLREAFQWQSFSYDGTLKRWLFSSSIIVTAIKEKFPEASIDPEVRKIIQDELKIELAAQTQREIIDEIKTKTDTDFVIKGIKGGLRGYQKIGVEFFTASKGRAILADDMGTGKTIQSLAYIVNSGFKRSLIVSPASVKFSWMNEVKKWTNYSAVIIDSKTKIHEISPDIKIWICNYDILMKHAPQLLKTHFDCIVGDESTYIKNPGSKRSKVFRQLARGINSVIFLSGTPILNRPSELFHLLNILDPKTWPNWYEYARRYCNAQQTRWGLDTSGVSNPQELHSKIKGYFLRRLKSDILKELPPKVFIDVPVELDKETAKKYDIVENDLAMYLKKCTNQEDRDIAKTLAAEKLARLNILRMLCSDGKIEVAKELIENIIETDKKVVVYASFVNPLKILSEYFGDKAVIITGETPLEDRKIAVERFQSDPTVQVFFGGYKSAATGITLTAAESFIGIDYPFTPSDLSQAIDRIHRIGQTAESLNIYQLVAEGTIDNDMKKMLERKQDIMDKIIDGQNPVEVNAVDMVAQRLLSKYN